MSKNNPDIKGLQLTKDFGSHIAISAGLNEASGDVSVIVAADLQDPPEIVSDFLK